MHILTGEKTGRIILDCIMNTFIKKQGDRSAEDNKGDKTAAS